MDANQTAYYFTPIRPVNIQPVCPDAPRKAVRRFRVLPRPASIETDNNVKPVNRKIDFDDY
jgi:hypothetical protein